MDEVTVEEGEVTQEVEVDLADPELAVVRELILKAHPDVVPDLIVGASIAELNASIETARAAYQEVIGRQPAVVASPPVVPAGGAAAVIDPTNLPAAEKIRRGLAGRSSR